MPSQRVGRVRKHGENLRKDLRGEYGYGSHGIEAALQFNDGIGMLRYLAFERHTSTCLGSLVRTSGVASYSERHVLYELVE